MRRAAQCCRHVDGMVDCVLACPGAEGIAKEVAQLREAAQDEMLLDEESSPTAVVDELQHLLSKLSANADELARINKYQQLFKVRKWCRAQEAGSQAFLNRRRQQPNTNQTTYQTVTKITWQHQQLPLVGVCPMLAGERKQAGGAVSCQRGPGAQAAAVEQPRRIREAGGRVVQLPV